MPPTNIKRRAREDEAAFNNRCLQPVEPGQISTRAEEWGLHERGGLEAKFGSVGREDKCVSSPPTPLTSGGPLQHLSFLCGIFRQQSSSSPPAREQEAIMEEGGGSNNNNNYEHNL